jgi:hypothetical protein
MPADLIERSAEGEKTPFFRAGSSHRGCFVMGIKDVVYNGLKNKVLRMLKVLDESKLHKLHGRTVDILLIAMCITFAITEFGKSHHHPFCIYMSTMWSIMAVLFASLLVKDLMR